MLSKWPLFYSYQPWFCINLYKDGVKLGERKDRDGCHVILSGNTADNEKEEEHLYETFPCTFIHRDDAFSTHAF